MTFHVGQKVVCIDDGPTPFLDAVPLVKGVVYTIANIGLHADSAIGLDEVDAGASQWFANRFRPVKTTNIDVFLQMLNPVREDA